jgi:HK97 family phage portal protein
MRGLGAWLNRDRIYTVTDTTDTAFSEVYTVVGPPLLAPDWGNGTYRGGTSIPAAWRASRLIADLVGGMPWHAYRGASGGTPISPTPPLLDQPAPPDTRVDSFGALVLDYVWHGTAVALLGPRDSRGVPTTMLPISAERVAGGYVNGRPEYSIDGKHVPRERLLVVKGPAGPGSVKGMSVLEEHFKSIDHSTEQGRQSRALSGAGIPTGVLQSEDPDVTTAELVTAKRDWLTAQRTRTIAALPPGVTFAPIAWNPTEMQMLEARKFDLATWELIFGLPVGFLGAEGPSMRYANMEQDAINLLKFTLGGIVSRFEQALTLLWPQRTVWVKANVDAILRSDTLARYQAHTLALAWSTPDEIRALEDTEPLPSIPAPSAEVQQALDLARAAPSLVQNPGLVGLVDQLRALNGKAPLGIAPPAPAVESSEDPPAEDEGTL